MCELDQIWSDFELCRPRPEPELKIRAHADYMCEHCGGQRQYTVFDDLPVCIDCGRVDYEFVSEEPEWRSGGDECKADPSRVGAIDTDAEPLGGGVGAEEALSRGDGVAATLSKTPEGEAEAEPSAGRAP